MTGQDLLWWSRQPLTWGVLLTAGALWLLLPGTMSSSRLGSLAWAATRRVLALVSFGKLRPHPRANTRVWGRQVLGILAGGAGLGLFATLIPLSGELAERIVFWLLAAITLVAAAAAIVMRSAVYMAVWFAVSLLGTAGLFLLTGAQFLSVATIVVYAGAIVVTFLFVIMLAQPEGHTLYDRVTWGWSSDPRAWSFSATPLAVVAGAMLVGTFSYSVAGLAERQLHVAIESELRALRGIDGQLVFRQGDVRRIRVTNTHLPEVWLSLRGNEDKLLVAEPEIRNHLAQHVFHRPADDVRLRIDSADVRSPSHMAGLGAELFGRHLVSVEVAGVLLLVALVGAIAIMIQGQTSPTGAEDQRHG